MRISLLHGRKIKWGLRQKLIILFSVFTIFPLAFVGYAMYYNSISTAQKFLSNYIDQTTGALNVKIDALFGEAISVLNIGKDPDTQIFINSYGENNVYEAAKSMGSIFKNIRKTQNLSQDIYDISIISADGKCVSERFGFYQLDQDFAEYPMIQKILQNKNDVQFFDRPESFYNYQTSTSVMSVALSIFKIGSNDVNGIVKVDIEKQSLQNILATTRWSTKSLATIINTVGEPIFENDYGGFSSQSLEQFSGDDPSTKKTTLKIGAEEYLIANNTLNAVPWKLIVGIPRNDILLPFTQTRYIIYSIIFFAFIIILLINTIVSNQFVRPIKGLKNLMKQASEGQFELNIPKAGNDEISDLYSSFDKMVKKIKQLLESLLNEQANLKSMELKALQAQINPHFLYNTLDSVVRVAESGKTNDVIDLIIALSHFYKAILSSGKDIIPLSREIVHVENYLKIMKMRYHDILDYEIQVDERTLDCTFPKITLQPIVENAIYHGIKNVRQGGKVSIAINLSADEKLNISISDNGIGMTDDQMAALLKNLENGNVDLKKSYGLINVKTRLELYFGKSCEVKIESHYQTGTKVQIIAPCRREQELSLHV